MKFEISPFNTFQNYFSADVMALYKGKWEKSGCLIRCRMN